MPYNRDVACAHALQYITSLLKFENTFTFRQHKRVSQKTSNQCMRIPSSYIVFNVYYLLELEKIANTSVETIRIVVNTNPGLAFFLTGEQIHVKVLRNLCFNRRFKLYISSKSKLSIIYAFLSISKHLNKTFKYLMILVGFDLFIYYKLKYPSLPRVMDG